MGTPGDAGGAARAGTLPPRERVAERIARLAGALLRATGAGAGRSLPGLVVERLAPGYLGRKAPTLGGGVVAVSGTNGKTTTASMLRAILRDAGIPTIGNESGANLSRGVVSALVDAPAGTRVGVFEIDEAHLVHVVPALRPRVLVLTNVFRDQLDRFAEPETVAGLLRRAAAALPAGARVVANADDPLLWEAVGDLDPIGFGVGALAGTDAGEPGADAEPGACPRCGRALSYEGRTVAHLGQARCGSCGWRSAVPAIRADVVAAGGVGEVEVAIDGERAALPLGGTHNAYNAAAAVAAAMALGVPAAEAVRGLAAFRPRFGRAEVFELAGRPVWILLMKNPAGAGVLIREAASDPKVGAAVVAVSDQLADGRDISWIWDADFERLVAAGLPIVPAGRRAADVAVRLKYAGAPPAPSGEGPLGAVRAAVDRAGPGDRGVVVLATYTAMLDLRRALTGGRRRRLDDRAGARRRA